MNEIRLAALDLDGTLLDRTSRITPRTLDALTEAIRRGVVVLPATGRALSSLPRVAAAIPGVRYAVTSNGAAVWDLGADPLAALRSRYGEPGPGPVAEPVCLYRRTLPADTARAVYRLLERYEGELNFFVDGRTLKTPAGMAWTRARTLWPPAITPGSALTVPLAAGSCCGARTGGRTRRISSIS